MKRASYKHGIAWIAENDEPEDFDEDVVARQISVVLVADLFDVDPDRVACDVVKLRKRREATRFWGA
jgi:hypothetical protein